MSDDTSWQGEAPQPVRRGPPKWMVVTGCGCLMPGFLLVAVVAWGMQYFAAATNPSQAYTTLAGAIPFDDSLKGRSTGLADDPATRALESFEAPEFPLLFGTEIPFSGGLGLYYFARGASVVDGEARFTDDALLAILTKVPSSQSGDAMRGEGDGEPFQLEVQGVTLSGLRFESVKSDVIVDFPRGTSKVQGPGVVLRLRSDVAVDPSDEDSDFFDVLLTMQRPKMGGTPVSDEEIREFLAPFHVGPAR